jgi:hypothetical protein
LLLYVKPFGQRRRLRRSVRRIRRVHPFCRRSLLTPPPLSPSRCLEDFAFRRGPSVSAPSLLTAASIRLMIGSDGNNDGVLDAARPNDQEASKARRVPARRRRTIFDEAFDKPCCRETATAGAVCCCVQSFLPTMAVADATDDGGSPAKKTEQDAAADSSTDSEYGGAAVFSAAAGRRSSPLNSP